MPTISQAILANQKRLNSGGPVASATETAQILQAQSAISAAPSPPPVDLPVSLPKRGVFPANLVLPYERGLETKEFRGPGMRSPTYPFPNIPISNQTKTAPSTVTPTPTPAPTPTPSSVGAPGSLSMPSIFSVGP